MAISYFLGVDGIAVLLIVLTTLLSLISMIWSWDTIKTRQREYYIAMLLLETGMLGVFMALDLFIFYIFWELMLIPMALLIGIWGSNNRVYAAIKFFLYTLFGSLLMLVGIVATVPGVFQCHRRAHARHPETAGRRRARSLQRYVPVLGVCRLLHRLRGEGADVPIPHLAPGCPRARLPPPHR